MSIIKSHDITLYSDSLTLQPLNDSHLPLLYRWNADPELLLLDGSNDEHRDELEVNRIYGVVSRAGHAFAIEVEGKVVGECLLAIMNSIIVTRAHSVDANIKRIDILIGERDYWGREIGSRVISMLVDFAFCNENVDVIYAVISDFNTRSRRAFGKVGFTFAFVDDKDLYYRFTRQDYYKKSCV